MKKIVFATLPMQEVEGDGWDPEGYVYSFEENKDCECAKKVHFAVDGFLAATLKKDEDVKVVRVLVNSGKSMRNAEIQKAELEELNKGIGAKIAYDEVTTEFDETSKTIEERFRKLIGTLEDDCEIVLDMTFGSKTLIPVLFYVLGFAEKFFNADIKNILYDKTEFQRLPGGKSVPRPDSCKLYDITPLFFLNSLANVMSAPDSKTALERLDKFFAL